VHMLSALSTLPPSSSCSLTSPQVSRQLASSSPFYLALPLVALVKVRVCTVRRVVRMPGLWVVTSVQHCIPCLRPVPDGFLIKRLAYCAVPC